MSRAWAIGLMVGVVTLGAAAQEWRGMLHEHPNIQYASRPTTDRIATLNRALAWGERTLTRDPRNGYLAPILDALGVAVDSQLLVFSKTGVQSRYTSPSTPRALYFDDSVVVGYVPGAPVIEVAAHDPQQGVVFYTVDQAGDQPVFVRRTSCLSCHVSASTLVVPGMIARSHAVGDDGHVIPQLGSSNVTHRTPHVDRWGGWFVTSEDGVPRYAQRAHEGNITFSLQGDTSNQVFVDWLGTRPETHGYPAASSDIVALLTFDHQAHAINLLTRLNWESRAGGDIGPFAGELADYLLFVGEAPLAASLDAQPGFAKRLESRIPRDHLGRSCGQLDLNTRLLRYPCSYMVYSAAFGALPATAKTAVYERMIEVLSGPTSGRFSANDRRAVLEILRETKPDFPVR